MSLHNIYYNNSRNGSSNSFYPDIFWRATRLKVYLVSGCHPVDTFSELLTCSFLTLADTVRSHSDDNTGLLNCLIGRYIELLSPLPSFTIPMIPFTMAWNEYKRRPDLATADFP